MDDQNEVINSFFTDNYQILLQKCCEYARVYNYRQLEPDEIISELYLYTLNDKKRTNKLQELIALSAVTISKVFKYSNLAMYYIARILFNVTHGHRTFDKKYYQNKKLKIIYCETLRDIQQEEIQTNNYNVEDIYKVAEQLGTGENWWKYVLWREKYINNKTYKEISMAYRLNTTPVFNGVRDFSSLIKKEIVKNTCKYEIA